MPKPFPKEFRRDVVEVARKREAPVSQVAKDFGISESCLHRWLQQADIEDGLRDGVRRTRCVLDRGAQKALQFDVLLTTFY